MFVAQRGGESAEAGGLKFSDPGLGNLGQLSFAGRRSGRGLPLPPTSFAHMPPLTPLRRILMNTLNPHRPPNPPTSLPHPSSPYPQPPLPLVNP